MLPGAKQIGASINTECCHIREFGQDGGSGLDCWKMCAHVSSGGNDIRQPAKIFRPPGKLFHYQQTIHGTHQRVPDL